ncbi:hypothetical protein MKZ12_26995 [Paenibacillus sp. FSL R5-0713]|uniref:hypothetical protein n=1 Tax=Paenibacillus sp. FSL R5-0713 TaxID=2921655 RepID=UPI0030D87137
MNITKIIKKALYERFRELSFVYQESSSNPWVFIRSRIGYSQEMIEIDRSDWESCTIRCTFQTGSNSISSTKLAEGSIREWYVYQSKEELHQILNYFGELVEKYALQWFAEHAVVLSPAPPNYLGTEWIDFMHDFIETNHIKLEDPSSVVILDELIKQEIDQNETYSVGFCFGEIIIKRFGAEWEYNKEQGPMIKNIAGNPRFKRSPHELVKKVLESRNQLSLQRYYNDIEFVVEDF